MLYIIKLKFNPLYILLLLFKSGNPSRYDHPHILAGQGTIGLEILEQVEDVDAIIIPVGGGGLIAGIAVAIKSLYPRCQIIVSSIHIFTLIDSLHSVYQKELYPLKF